MSLGKRFTRANACRTPIPHTCCVGLKGRGSLPQCIRASTRRRVFCVRLWTS